MFLLLLTSATVLFIVHYLVKFTYWKRRNIPGPTPLPFIGNTAASFSKDLRDVELERREKYGSVFGIYMGTLPFLVVSDPEICKIVTINEAKNFTDINTFKINQRFFKDSFITKKGQEWKNGRNLVTPCFTTKKIKEIYPQIKKSANPYFENIDNLIEQGKNDEVDLKKFAKGFSLDVVGKFVFAFDLNSAKDNDNPFVINARNVTDFKFWKMAIFNLLPNKVIEAIDLQILNSDALDYMGDLIKALTKQRRQNKDIYYNDFLDMIIRKIDENNLDVTQDQIIAHCIIFFFAGIETVAMTIANTFLNLSQPEYMHYQEKLYEELTKLYPDGEIEYDRLNESKLLDAVIKETQRVYPALSRLIRIAENPIEIKGIKIDAGTRVQIAVYALHMNKDFWGEDVNVFRPERFMEEGFRTEDENGIHFMPFGAGPRSCVAERLGLCQVKYLVARTVMKYRVYATDKTKPKYIKNPMALTYNELLLKFERRDKK